jgi:5S rRNA maturation endonuclease (ribonuclease M5)
MSETKNKKFKTIIEPLTQRGKSYLSKRGVKDINKLPIKSSFMVKVDTNFKIMDSERVAFPIYTPNINLVGYSARAILDNPNYPKYFIDKGIDKNYHLFGAEQLKDNPEKIILVEGQIDSILARQNLKVPSLAVLGSSLSEEHAKLLKKHGVRKILLIGDNDKAGRKFALESGKVLIGNDIYPQMGFLRDKSKNDLGDLKSFKWKDIEVKNYWQYLADTFLNRERFNIHQIEKNLKRLEKVNWYGMDINTFLKNKYFLYSVKIIDDVMRRIEDILVNIKTSKENRNPKLSNIYLQTEPKDIKDNHLDFLLQLMETLEIRKEILNGK